MIASVQYNAALAITGAIRVSSRDKLYHELGLESLHDRRWYKANAIVRVRFYRRIKVYSLFVILYSSCS